MHISPINSVQQNNRKQAFGAKLNGITIPDSMAKEVRIIRDAAEKLIGREVHGLETPIGNSKAVYDKFMACFKVNIDPTSTLDIMTYNNKLHSIYMNRVTTSDKGTKVIRTIDLYEGCEFAKDPIPSIYYAAHISKEPLSGYSMRFRPGDEVSQAQSEPITNVLVEIGQKLGLR